MLLILFSCGKESKKIYIKCIKADPSKRIDWYFYSLSSNFSKSFIQVTDGENTTKILESFAVTDIVINADTISIQLYENKYILDSSSFFSNGFNIVIDTTVGIWNQASSRLGRLQKKALII